MVYTPAAKPSLFFLNERPISQLPRVLLFLGALAIFKIPISVSYTKGDSKGINLTSKNDLKLLHISPITVSGRATVVSFLI